MIIIGLFSLDSNLILNTTIFWPRHGWDTKWVINGYCDLNDYFLLFAKIGLEYRPDNEMVAINGNT